MKPQKKASNLIEVRLPKDVHGHITSIAKFAGVPVNNVVKLAIAEGVLRGKARLKPQQEPEVEVQVGHAATGSPRYVNLGTDGKPTQGEHVAVYDTKTGLTWSAEPLLNAEAKVNMNHADAMKTCKGLALLGQKDWRAPTVQELLSIVDYDRSDPAVDPAHFKGPFGWTWTSTPYKGNPSGAAWYVDLSDGHSLWLIHNGGSPARAVRAGQQLDLG